MCYMPAKIFISAHGGNDHYIDFFFWQVRENRHHISHPDSYCNLKLLYKYDQLFRPLGV